MRMLPAERNSTEPRVNPGEESNRVLDSSVRLATVIVLIIFFSTIFIRNAGPFPKAFAFLAWYFAAQQDLPIAVGVVFFFLYVRFALRGYPAGLWSGLRSVTLPQTGIILIVALAIWLMRLQLLFDYDLSRDEQMANFDAQIFAQGRLYWPTPE